MRNNLVPYLAWSINSILQPIQQHTILLHAVVDNYRTMSKPIGFMLQDLKGVSESWQAAVGDPQINFMQI